MCVCVSDLIRSPIIFIKKTKEKMKQAKNKFYYVANAITNL